VNLVPVLPHSLNDVFELVWIEVVEHVQHLVEHGHLREVGIRLGVWGAFSVRRRATVRPVPPAQPRLTPTAAAELERLETAGHSVAWGRGTDGRTTFFWARITPHRSVGVRVVTAGDAVTLMDKAAYAAGIESSDQLVASLSDPLRTCSVCGSELSFDQSAQFPFACPMGSGHDAVRPV
jgi:hypothetical protein